MVRVAVVEKKAHRGVTKAVARVIDAGPPYRHRRLRWVWDCVCRVHGPLLDLVYEIDGEVVMQWKSGITLVVNLPAGSRVLNTHLRVDVCASEGEVPKLVRSAVGGSSFEAASQELYLHGSACMHEQTMINGREYTQLEPSELVCIRLVNTKRRKQVEYAHPSGNYLVRQQFLGFKSQVLSITNEASRQSRSARKPCRKRVTRPT